MSVRRGLCVQLCSRSIEMLNLCSTIAAGMCSMCWACTLETLERQGETAPGWWLLLGLAWNT